MQVQGFAAALAMLDDHESAGPPDGVESVYEGARYRKKKLGASGHATNYGTGRMKMSYRYSV